MCIGRLLDAIFLRSAQEIRSVPKNFCDTEADSDEDDVVKSESSLFEMGLCCW